VALFFQVHAAKACTTHAQMKNSMMHQHLEHDEACSSPTRKGFAGFATEVFLAYACQTRWQADFVPRLAAQTHACQQEQWCAVIGQKH
jgi:hypothetical protein